MPRITPSRAGGSATADRALSLLAAFQAGDSALSLAALSTRTGLYKSTALRLLNSLDAANFVRRTEDGRYALGGEILRLHEVSNVSGGLEDIVMPVLRSLVAETNETAALHVKRGNHRLRLYWVESSQSLREHVAAGETLPLDRGAGGLVLQAFSDAVGPVFDKIRRNKCALSVGGRIPELSGISAPVFGAKGELVGALTLTMPTHRWTITLRAAVLAKASLLTQSLGGKTGAPGKSIR